jgi:tRNA pseudouridine55 synthase
MDGVLLIDKPAGPTSHDVVARLRMTSGERRIGHTGTLDPLATGLLPLVVGKATRLSSLLTGGDKTYEALIRLGWSTTTDDAQGEPVGTQTTTLPGTEDVGRALGAFRGEIQQTPPRHSAKKVAGERAYDLARRDKPVELAPVAVTVHELSWSMHEAGVVSVTLTATAGFYVRALARDLGAELGCGAHLAALRRTGAGRFRIEDAVPLGEAERLGPAIASRLLSSSEALAGFPAVTATPAGVDRVRHGNPLGPDHLTGRFVPAGGNPPVRVLDPHGGLVAVAHARGGLLHPSLVVG